ncbi:ribitol-5-phosphate dehydrogenase [Lactococcus hodotermopsidis]|uniref:Ribulose-5-phosphate reductase n=1 Tax=Pseudolactococcus hodotermopsidis TaxID=2709157 RepID=A0A6A0B9W4_9LACT|nr:alcohol dehydrogenase catalytic domain-containing protein [Lactococcus hodotermopsidis]GFH42240.1 ribitol-5-phosphate dehydrogenase [Lactococcus hodotermopsidis]
MLNSVYRLVSPKQIEKVVVDEQVTGDTVIVRPTNLSICHADQRYFNGLRDKEILNQKLPMALIHEGMGEVVKDYSGEFEVGERVIIVPNTPFEHDDIVQENYLSTSKFRSSGYDGLMQEYVFARKDRLVRVLPDVPSNVAAYTELISVAMHGIKRLERVENSDKKIFGVWGDGNLGYIVSILLKSLYPNSKLYVFGKEEGKLEMFSFVDETFTIDAIPEELKVSNALECAGGKGSQYALDQIIDHIKPQGSIALMGVSENPIEVRTRMILEKGLTLSGSSRSGVEDFKDTINFLSKYETARKRFENLVGIERKITTIMDIYTFFEEDLASSWGKSVMKWEI